MGQDDDSDDILSNKDDFDPCVSAKPERGRVLRTEVNAEELDESFQGEESLLEQSPTEQHLM